MFDQWIEEIINTAHKYPRWRKCEIKLDILKAADRVNDQLP